MLLSSLLKHLKIIYHLYIRCHPLSPCTDRKSRALQGEGMNKLPAPMREALIRSGVVQENMPLDGEPLTGGVSSDIWRVQVGDRQVCIKRARKRLKVEKVWHAPIERHASEAAWFRECATIAPRHVPRILAHDSESGSLIMEYLEPDQYPVWKALLRDGDVDPQTVQHVARLLGQIHGTTARRPALAEEFVSDLFYHIRLEPYFASLAEPYPELAAFLQETIAQVNANSRVMVHGDFSPKNILIGPQGPVILDAECAAWSDPAFDLAFCLNHFLLKAMWNKPAANRFKAGFRAFTHTYLDAVDWEPPADLERRAACLLSVMMLARIDGKSPVEYITKEDDKDFVRRIALDLIAKPAATLKEVSAAWFSEHAKAISAKGVEID